MNFKTYVGLAAVVFALGGCAKEGDQIERDGGFFSSTKGPFIVVKQSGGKITDVYKLKNAIVQSEDGSDGWLFLDDDNHPVNIGGDMKSLRLKSMNDPVWSKYCEYHQEFDARPYNETCPAGEAEKN